MTHNQVIFPREKSDQILNEAIEKGEMGLLVWSCEAGTLQLVERITGYAPKMMYRVEDFIKLVIEDRDQASVSRLFEMYRRRLPKKLELTMRVKNKEGDFKQVLYRGELDTQTQSYYGVLYNITGNSYRKTQNISRHLIEYRYFLTRVKNLMMDKEGSDSKGALIGLSINNYKSLISNYDLYMAEEAIRNFINRIISRLKPADEISRFSDELFIIWFNEYDTVEEIEAFCNYILNEARHDISIKRILLTLQVNLGVTLYPKDSQKCDLLIKYTDFALIQSRSQGQNKYLFIDKEISQAYYRHSSIQQALPNAIDNDELTLHYQPQIDPYRNEIIGVEALIRWTHPELGNIPPNEFIGLAESKGYIHQLGHWILEEAIRSAKGWLEKGYNFSVISINISPLQIERGAFRQELLELCEKYQMPMDKIELEITEGTLLDTVDDNVGKLNLLREDGFKIALDDFGTGYSNFSSVLHFPITAVKIDKSMIDHIIEKRDFMVLKGVVALANSLNYQVVIEGVETLEQLERVRTLNCHRVQGYYYSRAVPLEEMDKLLSDLVCTPKS